MYKKKKQNMECYWNQRFYIVSFQVKTFKNATGPSLLSLNQNVFLLNVWFIKILPSITTWECHMANDPQRGFTFSFTGLFILPGV